MPDKVRLSEPCGGRIRRRRFLAGSLAGAAVAAPFTIARGAPIAFASDPFALGVASGVPREEGVVLWTRLAPSPLEGGAMPDAPVAVDWQIAHDEKFARVAAQGTVQASSELAHSVHVEVQGLQPGRSYWYRFRAGSALSPIGRTRTAPQAASSPARFRFAFASCQQYEQGYFAAYRDMAGRDLDLVVHLGDYIYEKSWGSRHVRRHGVGIPTTLPEFRDRYALYKLDPDLQAAHAAFPWLAIWDDHEVADDYADDRSYTTPDPVRFMKMRAAAYQAYYEHMPLPASARPRGPFATIYERYRFGDMLDVMLLDDRQYRSPSACVGTRPSDHRAGLPGAHARSAHDAGPRAGSMARPAARNVTGTLDHRGPADADGRTRSAGGGRFPPLLAGWLGRLSKCPPPPARFDRHPQAAQPDRRWRRPPRLLRRRSCARRRAPRGSPLATEFVGTSITSEGPSAKGLHQALKSNPHVKYGRSDKRGYATVDLTAARCTVGFEALDDEKQKDSPVRRLQTFVVEDGVTGARMA